MSAASSATGAPPAASTKKEIYTYSAPWPVYSLAASHITAPDRAFRFAVGSFVEEYSNKLQIIQLDEDKGEFVLKAQMDHPYPTTRVQWAPEPLCNARDMLATSGDYLRLWLVGPDGDVKQECTLNNVRSHTNPCPPQAPPLLKRPSPTPPPPHTHTPPAHPPRARIARRTRTASTVRP